MTTLTSTNRRTFVYISSADDADIGAYELLTSGELVVGARVKAGALVMPMAINRELKLLYAASRSKPFTLYTYQIDTQTGALTLDTSTPLTESFPFISLDKTGRYLFGASYGSSLVSVNKLGENGRVEAAPLQTVPVGLNAHSVRIDASNRFVFVPTLGSDEVFQFRFDASTGELSANSPNKYSAAKATGPRHFVFSPNNKFMYLLSELVGTVTTFSLSQETGLLKQIFVDSLLPQGSTLQTGVPRGPVGSPGTGGTEGAPVRNLENDIWAADIQITPNGAFLIASERTHSTLTVFRVDEGTGKITQTSSVQTEPQPRGFAIDPSGEFVVATGELSSTVSVYKLNSEIGTLSLTGKYPTGKASCWVEMISI